MRTPITSIEISKEGVIKRKQVAITNITNSSQFDKTFQALVFIIFSAFSVLCFTTKAGINTISGSTLPKIKNNSEKALIRP